MDALDVLSRVWLPLPAPQHQLIHLLGTRSRPLKDSALGDAFYHLEGGDQSQDQQDKSQTHGKGPCWTAKEEEPGRASPFFTSLKVKPDYIASLWMICVYTGTGMC